MNKTYYLTEYSEAIDIAEDMLHGFGNLVYAPTYFVYARRYFLIEDNKDNTEWLLAEILRGNIDREHLIKATFDLDRIYLNEEGYNFYFKEYYTHAQKLAYVEEF
jgi:hypothetical protein